MSNRFSRIPFQFSAGNYEVIPDYVPNLTGVEAIAKNYQNIWNTRVDTNLPLPKYVPTPQEAEKVQQLYVAPYEQRKENIVNALVENPRKGLSELNKFEKDLLREQQFGTFKKFEDNFNTYTKYNTELDQAVKDKRILPEERDASRVRSLELFGSSYTDDNLPNDFNGIDWAALQDYTQIALDYSKGWKADKFPLGFKAVGGGYLNYQTKEVVSYDEVLKSVFSGLANNNEVIASANYRGRLRGLEGEELNTFINKTLLDAATVAAAKEGFVQVGNDLQKDWILAQQNEFQQQFDLAAGIGAGTSELAINSPNALGDLPKSGGLPSLKFISNGLGISMPLLIPNTGKPENVGWDEYLVDKPEFAKANPAIVKLTNELPRNAGETTEEYNARFEKSWKAIQSKVEKSILQVENYGEKMSETMTAQNISNNRLDDKLIYVVDPVGNMKPINYAQFLELSKLTNEEFKKSAKINGQIKNSNGLTPTGFVGNITTETKNGKNAKTYKFIIPDNMEYNNTMKDVFEATGVLGNYGQDVSDPFEVDGQQFVVQKKRVYQKGKDGSITDYEEYPVLLDSKTLRPKYKPTIDAQKADAALSEYQKVLNQSVDTGEITSDQAENLYYQQLKSVTVDLEEVLYMKSAPATFNPLNFNQFGTVRSPKQDPNFTQIPLNK